MPRYRYIPVCKELHGNHICRSRIPCTFQRSELFCKHRRKPRTRSQGSDGRSYRQHRTRHRTCTLHGHSRFCHSYSIELHHYTGYSFRAFFQKGFIVQARKPIQEIRKTPCREHLRRIAADARQSVSERRRIHCQQDDSGRSRS